MVGIVDEWLSTADYGVSVDRLKGTTTGGLNGTAKITTTTSPNDFSNVNLRGRPEQLDVLTGGAAMDWFVAYLNDTLEDQIVDKNTAERVF